MSSIFYSLLGVLIGSFISWISNRWLNKRKLRMDVEIKVVDEICQNIVTLRENIYHLHQVTDHFTLLISMYLKDGCIQERTYNSIEDYHDEITSGIDKLVDQYERFSIYLDIKEIVIKESAVHVRNLYKAFWHYIVELDDLRSYFVRDLYRSENLDSTKQYLPEKDFASIASEFNESKVRVSSAYGNTLKAFHSLSEELLNKVYGRLFNKKRFTRIYEVASGELLPVENIYDEETAKQIYKQNRIKREI